MHDCVLLTKRKDGLKHSYAILVFPDEDILTGHRTVSAGTTLPREHALKQVYLPERSHVRMVFKLVGTPLSKFKDTKELANVFRDAIEGKIRLLLLMAILHG